MEILAADSLKRCCLSTKLYDVVSRIIVFLIISNACNDHSVTEVEDLLHRFQYLRLFEYTAGPVSIKLLRCDFNNLVCFSFGDRG
jgi:hypothetical protein